MKQHAHHDVPGVGHEHVRDEGADEHGDALHGRHGRRHARRRVYGREECAPRA